MEIRKLSAADCRTNAVECRRLSSYSSSASYAAKLGRIAKIWDELAQDHERDERLSWSSKDGLKR
jgi:hypothetical protein